MEVENKADDYLELINLIEESVKTNDFVELDSYLLFKLNERNEEMVESEVRKRRNFIDHWVDHQKVLPLRTQISLLMFEYAIQGSILTSTDHKGAHALLN